MPAPAGSQELTPARHHRLHRRQLVLRFTARIPAPGSEDEIGIQLRQALGADVDAPSVRDGLNQWREFESGVAQNAAQRVVAVHGVDFPLIGLNHRYGDFARVDGRLQRLDLLLISPLQNLKPRLRSCQLSQLAVDFRRAAVEMIDAHRRGNFR